MKKFIFTILPLFLLCIFLAKNVNATAKVTTPAGVNLNLQNGPNPGPPIGNPCGKTMCLEGETCVKYPQDIDEHCVREPISVEPDVPPDCWAELGKNNGVFPPNSTCWNHFKSTQTDIKLYDKTCIYQPFVQYEAKRYLKGPDEKQPFNLCGIGDSGPDGPSAPGGGDFKCIVSMLAYTDVRDAEMGSYGPNTEAINTYSTDFLAQNYLYNALFARPDNLSDTNREAYRTYWRLLPASNQANLRSFVMNMANEGQIENIHFDYTDTTGQPKQTDFITLFNALSKQVTLFWHFPFIRLGCLTDYPVCPEYAQATQELKPVLQDLLNTASQLNIPGANALINTYFSVAAAFGGDLDGPYAAITPLDFSSTRGYIVKKKDEFEEQMYHMENYDEKLIDQLNAPRYGTNKPRLTNISRESLPYVGAIYQGLLSPKFGMLPSWQPQWIVDKYTSPEGISDYKLGNTPSDLPEVKIAQKNLLQRIKDELDAFIANPLSWIATKKNNLFVDENKLKGYTATGKDNTDEEIRQGYVNMKGCPLPVSYHLLAPKTAAGDINEPTNEVKPSDHHQVISIDGSDLVWAYSPECHSMEPEYSCKGGSQKKPNEVCSWKTPVCRTSDEVYLDGDQCCRRAWSVTGIKNGKALTVLNNPKQTDIKEAVVNNDQYSFFKMILPAGASKITDASIDAPIAKHYISIRDSGLTATAPNGSAKVLNPAEPINRINNLAQDSMHLLQNCWTVPSGLQNSPRCLIDFPKEAAVNACTGEAFKTIVENPDKPSAAGESFYTSFIKPKLVPEVITAYTEAEKQTGVPCEVLAGIHYKEGDNNPDQDLQSGAPLNGRSLTESAIQAAEELKGKAGGDITDLNQLIKALSYYNGGGNSNCQASGSNNCATFDRCGMTVSCNLNPSSCTCTGSPEPGSCRATCTSGFPYQFSYPYCPPASTGYDDPYVTNLWKSPVHDQMYILYMYDCTQTKPYIDSRPGTLTVAISMFLSETQSASTTTTP